MEATLGKSETAIGARAAAAAGGDRQLRAAQQAVAGLLGRLGALSAGIGEEMRERYEHAVVLKEFAQTMYLAFGEDLGDEVADIRYDKMEDYGPYMQAQLLGDHGLRRSVAFLAADLPAARALLDKLEQSPEAFTAQDGLDLINGLLGLELSADLYRNAAGHGLDIAFDEMRSLVDDRLFALQAAIRSAQEPQRILQEILAGQEATLR